MNQAEKNKKIKKSKRGIVKAKVFVVFAILFTIAACAAVYLSLPYDADTRYARRVFNLAIKQSANVQMVLKPNIEVDEATGVDMSIPTADTSYVNVENFKMYPSETEENTFVYECDISHPIYAAVNLTVNGVFIGSQNILDTVHIAGEAEIKKTGSGRKMIVDEDNTLMVLLLKLMYVPAETKQGDMDEQLTNNLSYVFETFISALKLDVEAQFELVNELQTDMDQFMLGVSSGEYPLAANMTTESSKFLLKTLGITRPKEDYRLHYYSWGAVGAGILFILIGLFAKSVAKEYANDVARTETDEARQIRQEKDKREREEAVKRREERERLEAEEREKQLKEKERKEREEKKKERQTVYNERKADEFEYRLYNRHIEIGEGEGEKRDEIYLRSFDQMGAYIEMVDTLVAIMFNPTRHTDVIRQLKELIIKSSSYREGMGESFRSYMETVFGWSMCAYARCLALTAESGVKLNTDAFKRTINKFNEIAQKHDDLVRQYRQEVEKQEEQMRLLNDGKGYFGNTSSMLLNSLVMQITEARNRLKGGLIGFCLSEEEDLGFDVLFHIIGNNAANQYSSFMLQGLTVGLMPYLMAHRNEENVKDVFERMIHMRASLIDWDRNRTFFEVRIFDICDGSTFANILKEVLHCANPDLDYTNVDQMVEILETELPGVMYFLRTYPLRLIDISNEHTEGFYQMTPYSHLLVTKYVPPQDSGPVSSRYNHVVDQTLPNSMGINLRLFCDSYSVVPVLFHEFCHYLGNDNEAAVFTLTQRFSEYFYKKYEDTAESIFNDYTYVFLKKALEGKTPEQQVEEINQLIEKYYGEKMPLENAKMHAAEHVMQINGNLIGMNRTQQWHPDVPYPLLNKDNDFESANRIYRSIIRFNIAERTISLADYKRYETEWKKILEGISDYVKQPDADWGDLDQMMAQVVQNHR